MKFTLAFLSVISTAALAGGGIGGGGLGKELQEVAVSETMLSTAGMAEILGEIVKLDFGNLHKDMKSTTLMEGSNNTAAGILIEVQKSDFDLIVTEATGGKEIVYRNATMRATGVDQDSRIVTMSMIDDPSVTIVVKDAESN